MILFELSDIRLIDILDIVVVMFLLWQMYKLLKGTIAFNILLGVVLLYGLYQVVNYLDMRLLKFVLGPFVGFGVLFLIIIFQQEARQFLLILGNNTLKNRTTFFEKLIRDSDALDDAAVKSEINEILYALLFWRNTKVGALLVFSDNENIPLWNNSGEMIDARLTTQMLKAIFHRESPMHDGAAVIIKNRIYSVQVILPVTENKNIDNSLGLRHRAALGVTEKTNATALIVSEETGQWSYCEGGKMKTITSEKELKELLQEILMAQIS